GRCCVIVAEAGGGDDDRRVRRIAQQLPSWPCVHERRLDRAVTLKQESGAITVLRDGTRRAPVPDQCSYHVASGAQMRRQVAGLVAPVRDVRPVWAGPTL